MSNNYRRDVLLGKIYSEGYCCMWGYLTFCRAKDQGTRSMAEWQNVSIDAIRHHYRKLGRGEYTCQNTSDCIKPDIDTISQKESP